MKKFKDLEFKNKFGKDELTFAPFLTDAKEAYLEFENGYGISVICGYGAYGSGTNPYECAVLNGNSLCYNTPITNDVIGYCDEEMVTRIMIEIQNLKQEL
jgi:hypothetical protein